MQALVHGIKSLLASEKAIASGVLAVAATVFVFLDKMSVDEWVEYTTWVLGIYVGGKTIQGAVTTVAESKKPAAEPAQPDGGV